MISMNRGSRLIVWNVSIFTRIQKPWSCLGQYAKVTFFVFLHIDLWSNALLHCTVAYSRPTNWVICTTLPKVMQLFQIINHKGCIVCMYVCTKHLSNIHLNIWKDDRRSVLSVNTFKVQTHNKKILRQLLEEGRDAHNITANAASRFSFESALEEERWHKILQTMRSSQYF